MNSEFEGNFEKFAVEYTGTGNISWIHFFLTKTFSWKKIQIGEKEAKLMYLSLKHMWHIQCHRFEFQNFPTNWPEISVWQLWMFDIKHYVLMFCWIHFAFYNYSKPPNGKSKIKYSVKLLFNTYTQFEVIRQFAHAKFQNHELMTGEASDTCREVFLYQQKLSLNRRATTFKRNWRGLWAAITICTRLQQNSIKWKNCWKR